MNQLQALEEEDEPAGTSKGNQLEHLSGPSMMMSLVMTSCSADEERSAGARGPAGTEAEKSRKLELERESSAGALSVDDISSDIINQQQATVHSAGSYSDQPLS
ncbi:general transcriptional corepressor trfA [Dorcoceras hygrometricum]|uniref:General transcriptional corepressor trfA n=1 Tax=Dorcoceras hygrometricum TaxID=472368 RepID=A0A2Z7BZ74_9LAMI|nr:general transcriptional corepressor trfA [Dorcoceras hygrometricum]